MKQVLTENQKEIIKTLYEMEIPIEKMLEIMAFLQQETIVNQLVKRIKNKKNLDYQSIMRELAEIIQENN